MYMLVELENSEYQEPIDAVYVSLVTNNYKSHSMKHMTYRWLSARMQ